MQAARKLFGSPRRPQPRREQAALQEDGALSEDRFQVRCFCADSCSVSAALLLIEFYVLGMLLSGLVTKLKKQAGLFVTDECSILT